MTSPSNRVIFLDLDGPMIPGRAYTMPGQSKPIVKNFDPCAVGMLNEVCKFRGYQIVLHTSWIRIVGGQSTLDHCVGQGIEARHFHPNAPFCDETEAFRYTRVAKWLEAHPETKDYFIIDDEPYALDQVANHPHPADLGDKLILVDFRDGLLTKHIEVLYNYKLQELATVGVVNVEDQQV